MAPNLKTVEAAGIQGITRKNLPYEMVIDDFFDPVDRVKKSFANIIKAPDHQRIAIIPSVSYGIASVVRNIKPKPYGNIVVAAEQFPSNYYAWKRYADTYDVQIRTVGPTDANHKGASWNQAILDNIDKGTAVVAIGNVHWADGTLFHLEAIKAACQENDAYLILDGTQSVGAFPFDVEKIQPDALICAGYKWLFGPYAMGLAYYGPKFDNGIPIEENWINRKGSENFQALVNYEEHYHPLARKYNVGESSNFILIPMMEAALAQINEWGPENIQTYTKNLVAPFLDPLSDLGCVIEDDDYRCGHLFGLRLPKTYNLDKVKQHFKEQNIFVSFRGNAVRVSTHLYNRPEDLEKLLDGLRSLQA
ncbi:MAG: aminotransferase class V-fold PLP-dependent enzyme [Saprospiraceae bacterium]|nr:aminotransferase class V-fold PLP-dependent enzyme [Saprospiraceae bacterium]